MPSAKSSDLISRNLKRRLAVAFVLIPIALSAVWYGGWLLTALCAFGAGVIAFEWSNMAKLPQPWIFIIAAIAPVIIFSVFGFRPALATLWGGALISALFQSLAPMPILRSVLGVLYTGAIALALVVLREGAWDGQVAALILMGMVWASDSGAYFAGRQFGGPLLSPNESPNKTWSGAFGGVIVTALCGVAAAFITEVPIWRWMLFAALVSVVCQYGDMIESRIKRAFDSKDSSNLLPGHGGLMDRVDGLGAVCIVGASVFILFPEIATFLGVAG